MLGLGFVLGRVTAPEPVHTTTYVPMPAGDYFDVPLRILTGDGTGYVYECDLHLVPDAAPDMSRCTWPSK
jgi:hypothetical protein